MNGLGADRRAAWERGSALHLWLRGSSGSSPRRAEVRRYVIERGRIDEDGRTWLFTGPPPASLGPRLPEPEEGRGTEGREVNPTEGGPILGTTIPGMALQVFSSVSLHARTLNGVEPSPIRTRREWSITGTLLLDDGRRVPLGWSGPGAEPTSWDALRTEVEDLRRRLIGAHHLPAGRYRVLLAPQPAALLLHEAIGHFAEASAEEEIDLSHRLGCRIAGETISVEDDPLAAGGRAAYEYDDDNIRSLGPTRLVEAGRLIGQLHSRRSAERGRVLPTANGRAASSWDLPLPRISNLVCRPGTAGETDLEEQLGEGLRLERLANARATRRWIEAEVVLARRLVGGRACGPPLAGGRISAPRDLLRRVELVGRHTSFHNNALCGKAGQLLPTVGTAAPALCLSELEVLP